MDFGSGGYGSLELARTGLIPVRVGGCSPTSGGEIRSGRDDAWAERAPEGSVMCRSTREDATDPVPQEQMVDREALGRPADGRAPYTECEI